ncbi:FAD binding domain-containing protein [Azorhizobium doebereinerae]|uniref:FAD binding domain-containing protein n=1 Tax=Azorhizobium doebereinerae TaxID=281091 RepID=UPI0004153F03|nr:FAD binding domain-containing protein [Azorhizobium doebereinerae]
MAGARVIIVGGSMGGLFAGVLLHRAGFDVTVYERSSHGLEGRGAGLVAQREVFAILREVGVEHIARIGVIAEERIYFDRDGGIIQSHHMPQTQLSWDLLFRTFRDLLPPGSYVNGAQVTGASQAPGHAAIHLADGRTHEADLVIGADGIGSVLRADVAGPGAAPRYVGYATWRGLVPEASLPRAAADMLYGRFAFYEMPKSHILGYLVTGPDGATQVGHRRYNWVWYRPYPEAELAGVLTDAAGARHPFSLPPGAVSEAAAEQLHADADAVLPPAFAAAVRAEPRPFVNAICDYATPAMASGRLALLGDAAFVARPHTAMGVAKAAGDAFALRDALVADPDPVAALAAYARERLPVGRSIVAYGQKLGAGLA